jgi:hypothetical protein
VYLTAVPQPSPIRTLPTTLSRRPVP